MVTGELRKLRWKYIDRKANFIRLPAEITKEDKDKNTPINHHVKSVLGALPRHLNHDFVFTFNGKPIAAPSGVRAALKNTCKKAGVTYGRKTEDGIIMHDFRRTVKTNMLNAGMNKVHRDVILGNRLKGMEAHYISLFDDDLRQTMAIYTDRLDTQIQNVDHPVVQVAISQS